MHCVPDTSLGAHNARLLSLRGLLSSVGETQEDHYSSEEDPDHEGPYVLSSAELESMGTTEQISTTENIVRIILRQITSFPVQILDFQIPRLETEACRK